MNNTSIRIVSIGGRDLYSGDFLHIILRFGDLDEFKSTFELSNVDLDSIYEFEGCMFGLVLIQ